MKLTQIAVVVAAVAASASVLAHNHGKHVADEVIAKQRAALAENTAGKGFGPQSPRDLDTLVGNNNRMFSEAPDYQEMNLCNIHFHWHAEHKGGEFTTYAGNGDGEGWGTGYKYSGTLSDAELAPVDGAICPVKGRSLQPGDTIELHYVHSTAQVSPGPTLGACLQENIMNPQLRVETQVYVLVNDDNAHDFGKLTELTVRNGYHQAANIPDFTGEPIEYDGSTTGPSYNEQGSPLQVSWSVRPQVAKVNIETVGKWCEDNTFEEAGAHGVRNLVINPDLISSIDD